MKKFFAYLNEKTKGLKIYILALVAALPDIVDSLVGVDWTTLGLPEGVGVRVAGLLAIVRLVYGAVRTKMKVEAEKLVEKTAEKAAEKVVEKTVDKPE